MSIQKLSLIFLLTSSVLISFSQEDTLKSKKSTNLKIAYNSSLIYPGAVIGTETPIVSKNITKLLNKGGKREIVKDQLITANLSWYHHPGFHDNLYCIFGWTNRRTRSNGWFTDFSPELGYSRTFLGGTTYRVNNNGDVTIEDLAGYNYALISVGVGIGYDFSMSKSKPFLVRYKFNLLAMFPYNSTIYVRPAMEIGLIYKPSKFLSLKVKSKRLIR
jgi:hypothetical protein